MIFKLIKFEVRYWLRQPMVYIFLLINALLIFGASSSDNITVGSGIGNVHKNAPFVIQNFYAIMSLISLLMVTAFLNFAASRDYSEKTNQIIFSTPLKKFDFIFGRYLGACIIAVIPFLGISLGNIIGSLMPWLDENRTGAFYLNAHIAGVMMFSVPNILFAGAVIFSIAALTRNTIYSFIGTILLLVGYGISQSLISDLDNETLGALLDPFGIRTFAIVTKYWTVEDKNTLTAGFNGLLLMNRIIWIAVGLLIMTFTYFKFSFSEKSRKTSKLKNENEEEKVAFKLFEKLPAVQQEYTSKLSFKQFRSQISIETKSILKNTAFIIILIAGIINLVSSLAFATNAGYGNKTFPVTYEIIDSIKGSLFLFLIAIITFYTGTLVWKERDEKVNDIYDALPFRNWIPLLSKTIAMWLVLEVVLFTTVLVGILAQTAYGFYDFKISNYLIELPLLSGLQFFFLIVVSILIHVLVNNKYLGYFVFIAFVIVNSFVWPVLHINSNMVNFGETSSVTYSDINGFGPFVTGLAWLNTYWLLFSLILIVIALLFWVRGRDTAMKIRLNQARIRYASQYKSALIVFTILWVLCASFVFYNTKVVNTYKSDKELESLQVEYEKLYKKYENLAQPRITDIKFTIDLFPKERALYTKQAIKAVNKSTSIIDSVHFSIPNNFEIKINIANAKLVLDDKKLDYRIYQLAKPLNPGDTLYINVESNYISKGFENEVSVTSIVQNGSFFNNADIMPQIGYQESGELSDKEKRKENGLPEKKRMAPLQRNCTSKCMSTYLSNNSDWVNVETIISTPDDEIAIAPGSLIKKWNDKGRTFYNYKLDHESMNFYSFMSAKYQIRKEKWNGIDIEIYYIPEHKWNVEKMVKSVQNALKYYTENFGPYYHKQCRIIEFPRYASFAQAFPGTMPYSESIGFIDNLEDEEDIDMVYYVVAHEMGHQWWAHQVVGADMQGATVLSETMAQYSALMVMEKMYGKPKMRKFLKYEMDNYLRSRGTEREKELALLKVENQGYIHYRKGSVVMYYLKEMIGEKAVNSALKNMIDSFAYRQPPYPNSYDLVDRFNAVTPDSLKYLINDLFYDITLFDNKTKEASYKKLANGKYEVSITIEANKLKADSVGKEVKIPIKDWIEIGVLKKPSAGKIYGKLLYSKTVFINKEINTFKFTVDELPYEAGIDPNFYLVDRMPKDNLKKL